MIRMKYKIMKLRKSPSIFSTILTNGPISLRNYTTLIRLSSRQVIVTQRTYSNLNSMCRM